MTWTHGGKTCNVNAGEESGYTGGGLVQVAKPVETCIWHGDTRLFWVDRSVRKVGSLSQI